MDNSAVSRRRHNTTLRFPSGALRALNRRLDRACALSEDGLDAGEALNRLCAEAPVISACAAQAAASGVKGLPGRRGVPDLCRHMRGLLAGGERPLTQAALMDSLRGQALPQRALWAAPEALRVAISEGFDGVAQNILADAEACARAERFVSRPLFAPRGRRPAFYEHALRLCGEAGLPRARALLEAGLRASGMSPERAVALAHEARAHDRLRLENLCAARRMLDALNWQACFEALSEVDAELRRDPAGVYPRMDDASRQRVREQVERLARAVRQPERDVAEAAVTAARECAGNIAINGFEQLAGAEIAPHATVCHWLYDDAGRRALLRRMGCPRVRVPRMVPDPGGRLTMACVVMLTGLIAALLDRCLHAPALIPALIPAAWAAAQAVIARVFPWFVKPAVLLKLDIHRLPDRWRTLVVTPVLIPDAAHARAMCDNLEALGCLETDPNLSFLLLGDFADAGQPEQPGDAAILETVQRRIDEMNRRAGREKYHFLHRPRTLLKADGRWMGRDRKRGALMDLNALLLGGKSAFLTDGAALRKGFRWVLTLDADTRMLPGDVHRLVGAAAHPMNRAYCVFQPRMETAPSACKNRFSQLFFGAGGLDTYPTAASSLWMDLTGGGVYGGKGLYDVARFQSAVADALPEGRILSHDLIEGALSGTASLGDTPLFDGCPGTLMGWARRLHRWTRGDWQLLPLMLSPKCRLAPADRFKMLDNLLRSLRAPALLAIFLWSAWAGSGEGLAAALVLSFLNPMLNPSNRQGPLRALCEVAVLPLTACLSLDAALRALWRLYVSGRHLMDWVPSADADRGGRRLTRLNRLAALFALSGLRHPNAIPMALGLFALFWTGADWVCGMADEPVDDALSPDRAAPLLALARDTWRFFEACDTALPPDNVQLDPPAAPVRRTSPTNIGLYLLSCVAAHRLNFIDRQERDARIAAALDAVDRTEKWRGHLYNWIDIDTLAPLRPRYVSSVDSGNLAACALACANAVGDEALSRRLRALAAGMDFAALFDGDRKLFCIGMDADASRLSQSRYDLLASESRLLSYVALMLGQIPLEHWRRLSRPCARVGKDAALLSWSGTLFEYLMPELLLRAPARSLLGQSARTAVAAQMAHGQPWGVSESGYHAFDAAMNYQYRAFGLKALALNGDAVSGVVAPYASALALAVAPDAAADNLAAMANLGWRTEYGMIEAADCRHDAPALVRSHMAHHQGMALCAICNALTGDALVRAFMADPRARALSLLLEERPAPRPRAARRHRNAAPSRPRSHTLQRGAQPGLSTDVHLLKGRDARAFVAADGSFHYARNGVDATRFGLNLAHRPDAARLLCRVDGRVHAFDARCRAAFRPGAAVFEARFGPLRVEMSLCLSPEDDTLYRHVALTNTAAQPVRAALLDLVPVALARPEDYAAHPAFQLLFVEAEPLGENGLLFRRRPRTPGEAYPSLVHIAEAPGEVSRETRSDAVMDREGHVLFHDCCHSPKKPPLKGEGPSARKTPQCAVFSEDGPAGPWGARTAGRRGSEPPLPDISIDPTPLNPVSALCVRLSIAPGETVRAAFALRLTDDGPGFTLAPERAAQLSRARAEALLDFLGISPALYHRLDRLSALLLDPRLAAQARADRGPAAPVPDDALWSMGISGDRPILSMTVTDPGHAAAVRTLLRAHGFYRAMGLGADLVFIDGGAPGYHRPVRDMIRAQADASPLPADARILENLSDAQREALRRASALALTSGEDLTGQLNGLASRLRSRPAPVPVHPGPDALTPVERLMFNGFGGFIDDGYAIDVAPGHPTPAPWCNILANDHFGLLLTERGGGFLWRGNSRSGRLTPWRGDPLREGYGLRLSLCRPETGEALSLLPGERPAMAFRVTYTADDARYSFATAALCGEIRFRLAGDAAVIDLALNLRGLRGSGWQVTLDADWLMGTDPRHALRVQTWEADGAAFAVGVMAGVGWLTPCRAAVHPGENRLRFAVGWSSDAETAQSQARRFREGRGDPVSIEPPAPAFETPDEILNRLLNAFIPHQVLASRVLGRTGWYQPGGAYGFRDQLQDMLALLPVDPDRVRRHLLLCAGRQFAAGDVLHWWHMPFLGPRTRIQDDRLFLPYVTAEYVRFTGDADLLRETVPYLADVPIPEGREDVFRAMAPGDEADTLHGHCMRAFDAIATGSRGLALMGAGDWNDGMDRVGREGRGESVWLSMFIAACADSYAEICPDEADVARLRALAANHRAAVEAHGWDGQWYRRAFADDGTVLGGADSPACRIDLIAQAWAVLAGLDEGRSRSAVDSAWQRLVDEDAGIIRLLDPPFGAEGMDPGYIRGYPGGVRENGAQYTHAACWLLLAHIRLGDADRAHRAMQMLLPPNHADTPERASRYAVEPYVMAGDVYALPARAGRGGWTWYTGSAAWYYVCAMAMLGFERRGDCARLSALLGDWPEAALILPVGRARYRLVCRRDATAVTLDGKPVSGGYIRLVDDGREHEALFPPRQAERQGRG